MTNSRAKRAQLNIVFSLILQIVTVICGLVVPRLLLVAFGSEVYGATSSIIQFLSYIALLEGGVGGVARAALYKPLVDHDEVRINVIINEIKRFFFYVGCFFVLYVLVLSVSFKSISHVDALDWFSTFLLVWAISFSTFLQYFVGLPYGLLIQADQKNYITAIFSIITITANAILVYILVACGCGIIAIKFVSSLVFAIKPILQNVYVRRHYKLFKTERDKKALSQKWTGLGQHLAFFVHSNTDVVVLTVLSNLKIVAVYAVYHMVIISIQDLTAAFSSGMEALFGELYARDETHQLNNTFSYYETLIGSITILLFSVTGVMIIPFVKLYTKGINDVNYIVPAFSMILLASSVFYCLRLPYHSLVIAAGKFKETRIAAYGEAIINISISIVLVLKYDLIGVAIGTLCATIFRFAFYVIFLSCQIINRPIILFVKRLIISTVTFFIILTIGTLIIQHIVITNYFCWAVASVIVVLIGSFFVMAMNMIFYRKEMKAIVSTFGKKVNIRK